MVNINGSLTCFSNPKSSARLAYTDNMKEIITVEKAKVAVNDFLQWPGYANTPLLRLNGIAKACGIKKLWYKDESHRFEIKSFKALGGSYAVAKQLLNCIDKQIDAHPTMLDYVYT